MAKTLTSAAMTAFINAALIKHAVCTYTGAEGIEPIAVVRARSRAILLISSIAFCLPKYGIAEP